MRRRLLPAGLWRKVHKWVGLTIGLQFVLWTFSGAIMALLDMDKVGGHAPAPVTAIETSSWPERLAPVADLGPVDQLTLRRLVDRPVYEVARGGETTLIDAANGQPLTIDGRLATAIARDAFHHTAPIRSVTRLSEPNMETREAEGPLWRVDFADAENSSAYVSAVTGRPVANRGDTWRTWDFVWMLHNMDYANRTSFNHPLIIFFASCALWLSSTGFYLLFKSFRRRDVRWLVGQSDKVKATS